MTYRWIHAGVAVVLISGAALALHAQQPNPDALRLMQERRAIEQEQMEIAQHAQAAAGQAPATQTASTKPIASAATTPSTQPARASATQPSPEILALVNDLSSDSFDTRQSAQKKLIQLGEPIVPELQAVLKSDLSEEARARVAQAIDRIQELHLLGPSIITMHYKDAPAMTVLEDFTKQVQADLGIQNQQIRAAMAQKKITIDLDRANFWDSLQEITKSTGLHIQQYGQGPMQFDLNGGNEQFNKLAKNYGAFLVVPIACQQSRSVQYGIGGNSQSYLNFQLAIYAEPKLHIINNIAADWMTDCTDNKGHSLSTPGTGSSYIFHNQSWMWNLQANIREVHDMGSKIASMRGDVKFNVATKSENIDIDDMAKLNGLSRNTGGSVVTIGGLTQQGNMWQLRISITGPMANGDVSQLFMSSMQLLDDKGNSFVCTGLNSNSFNGARAEMTIGFQPNGPMQMGPNNAPPPAKHFKWQVATETKQMPLTFELTDLDLPVPP